MRGSALGLELGQRARGWPGGFLLARCALQPAAGLH